MDNEVGEFMGEVKSDIRWIKDNLKNIQDGCAKRWVQTVVSGMIGTILTAVIVALLAMVVSPKVLAMVLKAVA